MTRARGSGPMTARRHEASRSRARRLLEVARDPGPQLDDRERLAQVVVGTDGEAGSSRPPARADSRTTGMPLVGVGARIPRRAVPVQARHHDVGDDEVGSAPTDGRDGREPVRDELDVVVLGEDVPEVGAAGRRCPRRRGPGAAGGLEGSASLRLRRHGGTGPGVDLAQDVWTRRGVTRGDGRATGRRAGRARGSRR